MAAIATNGDPRHLDLGIRWAMKWLAPPDEKEPTLKAGATQRGTRLSSANRDGTCGERRSS